MKKHLKRIGIIVQIIVGVVLAADAVLLLRGYLRTRKGLRKEAEKKRDELSESKQKSVTETLEKKMDRFEEVMVELGAEKMDGFNEKNIEDFEQRSVFRKGKYYYRIDHVQFETDGLPYIIVSAIDKESFARIGIMEEIEAFPHDIPDERIREVVKEIFETEL